MEKVFIYYGSDDSFEEHIEDIKDFVCLTDILGVLSKSKIEVEGIQKTDDPPLEIENLIIRTDDYGSLKEWALLGFTHNVLLDSRVIVKKVWMNNPPRKIYLDIKKNCSELIEEDTEPHAAIGIETIKNIAYGFSDEIIGQQKACRRIMPSLYALTNPNRKKPISLLFLGPSGVGKTEAAKYIADQMEGELLRVQFSMQQTNKAYNFIFGSEHGENSLARELIRRKSNVILLDEFDKVNQSMYNAFYQMFDDGKFVDSTYEVNLERTVIICTSNFMSEKDAENYLGTPIYSRFSKVVVFDRVPIEDKLKIAKKNYESLYNNLTEQEKELIASNGIYFAFEQAIRNGAYENMRMLKNDIEDALNYELLKAHGIVLN